VLARNARRVRPGDRLDFEGSTELSATVIARDADGGLAIRFDRTGEDFSAALRRDGALALPPYIARPDGPGGADEADYQTMFARADGAVAAPTAGLHFTPALLDALAARGVRHATVTLHVGAGTFLPVRVDDLAQHRMHPERGTVTAGTADAIARARRDGGRVVAVGTTSLRVLEAAAGEAFDGETDLFILPGYRFRVVDVLLTNFHLPRSTLFMLVCAFAGTARMRAAYEHAIETGYRFYSYGDACLLDRAA
jgi:S-adenosylmethionine:tRNA ribosyltransferase-isomerase